jgi:GMP synthase-like glutamine amidotransferase
VRTPAGGRRGRRVRVVPHGDAPRRGRAGALGPRARNPPSDFTARWRGAVVGGSPFNVTDPEDTKTDAQRGLEASLARLADAAASGRIAALFTCYGIGVATRALGGEVTRTPKTPVRRPSH